MFFLKRYKDTERTSPMKRTTNNNGKGNGNGQLKTGKKGNVILPSFVELAAGPKVHLRNKSLLLPDDPRDLSDGKLKKIREEFLFQFPELAKSVPNIEAMRRLTESALKAGKKHLAQMKSGRSMAPTSL